MLLIKVLIYRIIWLYKLLVFTLNSSSNTENAWKLSTIIKCFTILTFVLGLLRQKIIHEFLSIEKVITTSGSNHKDIINGLQHSYRFVALFGWGFYNSCNIQSGCHGKSIFEFYFTLGFVPHHDVKFGPNKYDVSWRSRAINIVMFDSWVTSLESRILKLNVFSGIIFVAMMTMSTCPRTTCSLSHKSIIWFHIRSFSSMASFFLGLLHRTFCLLLFFIFTVHGVINTIVALIVKKLSYVVLKVIERLSFCYIINSYTTLSVPKVMSWYWLKSFLPSSIPNLKFDRNFIDFH